MKVCFVSPGSYGFFNPKATHLVGGAERQMYLWGKYLSQDIQNEITFCVADFGQPVVEVYERVKLYKSFKYNQNQILGFIKLLVTFKKTKSETFVFRGPSFGTGLSILALKLIYRKKHILYMLASSDELKKSTLKKSMGFLTAHIMALAYKKVDKISAQSVSQFNDFKLFRDRSPNAILRNLVESTGNCSNEKKIILWIGRAVELKQPDLFLDLALSNPDFNFLMICPYNFDDICYNRVKDKAKKINNLEFISSVPPSEIGRYFSMSMLYTITSVSEGFSNSMLEAFANGVPILSLNIDPDDIIKNFKMGCVLRNFDEFKSKFKEMVANLELLAEMSQNEISYVKQYHSTEVISKVMINLLHRN